MSIFKPKMYAKDIFKINYDKLKSMGIKCLLFDLDNTIEPVIIPLADEKDVVFFNSLKKKGFEIIIMSNSRKKRVTNFAKKLDVKVNYSSMKPLSKSYYQIMRKYKLNKNEVAAIGDQIMTDVLGANKVGIYSILVDPISNIEEKCTKFNRFLEKMLISSWEKKGTFKRGKYYE